jgi:hypothetical protein
MAGGSLWRGRVHLRDLVRRIADEPLPTEGETVRYMLLVCVDPTIEVTPEERAADAWVEEMSGRGVRLQGQRLRPISDATTVRLREGEVVLSDGPFAETKELIAGFDVIECEDLDEAIEVASKHPVARFGAIEVRPFWEE